MTKKKSSPAYIVELNRPDGGRERLRFDADRFEPYDEVILFYKGEEVVAAAPLANLFVIVLAEGDK